MPVNVLEVYANDARLNRADVLQLLEWCNLQPHLPPLDELALTAFMVAGNYSSETAKARIDKCMTIRTLCPEFFTNRNPFDKEMETCLKTVMFCLMPQKTPEGYGIIYNRLIDSNPDNYNCIAAAKIADMAMTVYLREKGPIKGYILIMDVQGCSLAHLFNVSFVTMKKHMLYMQEGVPAVFKGIHYVNAVSFMDKILSMVKPLMKKELIELLHVHHGNNETLRKHIPLDCIPSELGGQGASGMAQHHELIKLLHEYKDWLISEEKLVVDETKRPGKPTNPDEMFGVEGTFKKLDID